MDNYQFAKSRMNEFLAEAEHRSMISRAQREAREAARSERRSGRRFRSTLTGLKAPFRIAIAGLHSLAG